MNFIEWLCLRVRNHIYNSTHSTSLDLLAINLC